MSEVPELLLTIDGVRRALNIGETKAKELVSSGAIESVRIGRCRRVPLAAIADYVDRLRADSGRPRTAREPMRDSPESA